MQKAIAKCRIIVYNNRTALSESDQNESMAAFQNYYLAPVARPSGMLPGGIVLAGVDP